jgi:hypothetical protein
VQTIEEQKHLYTKRQVKDTENARLLMKRLGYSNEQDMFSLISKGVLINSPVTAHDVHRAQDFFGPYIASLAGKTKLKKTETARIEFVPMVMTKIQTMHADIMYVSKEPYLVHIQSLLN